MATGDTASDPFSRAWPNEARRDLHLRTRRHDPGPLQSQPAAASPKSTAKDPAQMLRKSGPQHPTGGASGADHKSPPRPGPGSATDAASGHVTALPAH